MGFELSRTDYDHREVALAKYVEATRPMFPRFRWGRVTEAELVVREARLTRLREQEEFKTDVERQHHRIYLTYNEEVSEHEAAVMADVKRRSIAAKGEILKALDRQDAKTRAEEMIADPLEVREVHERIDAIYFDEREPVPVAPPSGSVNGTRNAPKVQKQPPEKESIV